MTENRHVLVVGLDDTHRAQLERIRRADHYTFHALYRRGDVKRDVFPVTMLLEDAPRLVDAFPHDIAAIVGYWDFPVSTVLPLLRAHRGLPGPSLESVLKCEHKFWSRFEQARTIPGHVPRFQALDPFAEDPKAALDFDYPFWIKPVKAVLSQLGFRVENDTQFEQALDAIRQGIERFAEPFNQILSHVELPPELEGVDGYHCIVEEIISEGRQVTVEGYVLDGKTTVYGVIDSKRQGPQQSSFSRYQYPSQIPWDAARRMEAISARFLEAIGFDQSPFNIEYYWNEDEDTIHLLEVNPRVSKSHSPLFEMVDGCSHFQVMVEVALGNDPAFPQREGEHAVAAKFMVRREQDARVTAVPSPADIARVMERFPGTAVEILVEPGMRLSDMRDQESYSYEVAVLFMGADSEAALLANYDEALGMLPFEYAD